MELAVVGCGIFKNEIEFLKTRITAALDFFWLPQRLHSKPLELRRLIQAEIDRIDEAHKAYDGIALLYGLCSKGTIGVSSRKYPIAVPKVQDCIGILLGSNERYMAHFREKPGTYWFTKGWFETGFNPGRRARIGRPRTDASSGGGAAAGPERKGRSFDGGVLEAYKERYLEYRKKFGEETSRYLINEWDQRWIGNYTTLAFIDWGMKENRAFKKRAEESAAGLGLEFEDIPGDPSLLMSLLNGEWTGKDARPSAGILVAPPGRRVMPSYDLNVLTCSEAAGGVESGPVGGAAGAAGGTGGGGGMEVLPKGGAGQGGAGSPGASVIEKTRGSKSQAQGRGGRSGIGLGIDAGGTYTDTVIYDFSEERVVASAKALTTHDDYSVGIAASLRELLGKVGEDVPSKIGLVSLSTTVATNAIVEGKGGSVGIILIGYDASTAHKIEFQPQIVIRGKHDIHGEVIEPLDEDEARGAVRALLDRGVDAIAVSSEVGVRNPAFELAVRDMVRELSPMPVVCGSELTAELNCVKRANTCFFNARLIPLVSGLLNSVRNVLRERSIQAPIMVVKGDGTLMGEEVARRNPVEMVLSGPAASVIGGLYLSGIQDGLVVDMGGTTTDVALVKGGFVSYKEEGVHISGFKTAVRTVNVYTFGLGGDSYIRYETRGSRFTIGPERVIPLSCLARSEPRVSRDLASRPAETRGEETLVQPADYFVFQKDIRGSQVHPQERAIVDVLKRYGPMSRTELAERVRASSVALLRTERLEMFGSILRSALTPTDLLHAAGQLDLWDAEAARRAVALFSRRADLSGDRLITEVFKEFYRKLLYHLFDFWFTEDGRLSGDTIFSQDLASHLFFENKDVHIRVKAEKPLIFIGAPAHEYAAGLKNRIDLSIVVPEFHEVANAVGAITGAIREDVRILIRPHIEGGYVAYTQEEMRRYETLSEAKQEMAEYARDSAARKARENGALSLNVDVKVEDKEVKVSENDTIYLETVITATVASIPIMKT